MTARNSPPMRTGIGARLALDLAMALLFVASLGFRTTGAKVHEWLGVVLCSLFVVHMRINWRWYRNILKGGNTFRRYVNVVLNLLLPVTMLVLFVSGVMNSRHVFGFLEPSGGMAIRQVHSFAAYWGIVLIGVHTGMHWTMVIGTVKKLFGLRQEKAWVTLVLRGAAFMIAVYGIWASFDRAMGSKLFLGFSFDFWYPGRPEILFYTHNLAVLALYITVTHYALKSKPPIGQ
jgi:hypothetical protein